MVKHAPVKREVAGSSPARGAIMWLLIQCVTLITKLGGNQPGELMKNTLFVTRLTSTSGS